jgi:hypothetical protein
MQTRLHRRAKLIATPHEMVFVMLVTARGHCDLLLFAGETVAISVELVDVLSGNPHGTLDVGGTVSAAASAIHVTGNWNAPRVVRVAV